MNPKQFFVELKRRNVYKVAIAYAVVAWLLMQVASQIFPFFEIPNWAVRLVVLLLVIGFPVALILAWAFELTPEGIKRTEDAGPDNFIPRKPQPNLAPEPARIGHPRICLEPLLRYAVVQWSNLKSIAGASRPK